MTLSTSVLSYQDCFDIMAAALADEQGVRVRFETEAGAYHFRIRAHYARKLDRKANLETYEKGHPRHGISEYDRLMLRIATDGSGVWWVYIVQSGVLPGLVESLSSGEALHLDLPKPIALPSPPRALPAPTPPDLGDAFDAIEAAPEPEPEIIPPTPKLRRL